MSHPTPARRPDSSVIICTWNRASFLKDALRSVLDQDLPRDRYEIIVVDNASTDDTASVIGNLNAAGAGIVSLRESRLGVAYARNAGWRAAGGEIVVFFDDDCLAPRDWLRQLTHAMDRAPASVGCVGGPVRAVWPRPRPTWLSDALLSYLGMQDLGGVARGIAPGEWLCSNNLAVRRTALESVGGFPEDLGRRGARLVDGAETETERRLMRAGLECRYDPVPWVEHRVEPERLRWRWFLRRAFWGGASAAWAAGGLPPAGNRRAGLRGAGNAVRSADAARLACTVARAAGLAYGLARPNPYR